MGWIDGEPVPAQLPDSVANAYGYRLFSARTGNIYTASLLLQWLRWATGAEVMPEELWPEAGRIIDPFRPRIEPDGFADRAELESAREATLAALRRCLTEARVFVFTLGLTESWWNSKGWEYPLCPGTAGGVYDPAQHRFVNQSFEDVRSSLIAAIRLMRGVNPGLKVLLTVSPVPLTATASGRHIITATTESKAILRAVAGEVARSLPDVDYFPSYEIIASPAFRSVFFGPNLRSVSQAGVDFVMAAFFRGLERRYGKLLEPAAATGRTAADVQCDEAALAAFGDR